MSKKRQSFSRTGEIKMGFDGDIIELAIDQIMPSKILEKNIRESWKYKQILNSIREIGIIESLIVTQEGKNNGQYILLDGHLRIEALKELGESEVTCLISTDNEAYTYNKYVNRLSPIQEHRMVLRAVKLGVPQERIAKVLNLDILSLRNILRRLHGIPQYREEN
jgi:ParB-like chromosome segregation protein Spo0J